MRRVLLRPVMLVLVLAMLGGHVTELFDDWDQTMQTGSDSDYLVVLIAACIGVAFVAIKKVAAVASSPCSDEPAPMPLRFAPESASAKILILGPAPPLLLPIRI